MTLATQHAPVGEVAHELSSEVDGYPAYGMQKYGQEQPISPDTPLQLPQWKWSVMIAGLFLMMAVLGFDSSNLADIQISIYGAFGHIDLLPWVMAAFSLANAAAAPLMKRLMDISDLKWFSGTSLGISAIGGIVSGSSNNMETMIAGRLILGIGISGAYLGIVTLLKLITTPTQLARINGLAGGGFAIGILLGPVIGAAFAQNEHTTWRWASYIIAPWIAVIVTLNSISFPSVHLKPTDNIVQALLEIDWIGEILHIATLVLFNTGCLFSGTRWSWDSGSAIATWVVFGVVAIVYGLQQYFCWFTTSEHRIFPVGILSCRVGFLVYVATACSAATYGVALYYTALYFAFTHGFGAMQSAVHLLPLLCPYIVFALISGTILPRIGIYPVFFLLGGIFLTVGSGVIMVVNYQTSTSNVMGLLTLIGAGIGTTFQLGVAVLPVALPPHLVKDFGIFMNQAQYIPITMGLSLAGCIYQNVGFNRLMNALDGLGFSADEVREALAGLNSPILQGKNAEIAAIATSNLVDVIVKVFLLVVAAGIVMILSACVMKWEKLDFRTEAEKNSHQVPQTA
ncbi:major facilitator superfamily transporter [Thozetella sp. PMI_491]|nr:major facilitator superfamily transporter [Thozetella sp. PMI_491]